MDIGQFFSLVNAHPWAYPVIFLNLAVIFINGWTDGPNAIATCVTTRCIKPRNAVIIAAIGNVLGILLIGLLGSYLAELTEFGSVAKTIASLANFDVSTDASLTNALIAVSAGLLSIVIWSLGSTYFGFPSSESNELVGGVTGGAMALGALAGMNWFSMVGWSAWSKVLIGFFGSLILGFLLGYVLTKLIEVICRKMTRGKTTRFFIKAQIVSAGAMSFVHGIQDGSKFIGIFILLATMLEQGNPVDLTALQAAWWLYVPVAVVMAGGTLMGGYSIIKTLGKDMAVLQKYQAFATDVASVIGLLLATVFGLPVSTGSVKSTSILGCGATRGLKKVHWNVAGEMIGSWVIIFPATALIGFLFTLVFASIF
jgi:PiT family inorganic phosphate transporter